MTGPALHDRFPGLRSTLPHLALGERPTPVRPLPRLAEGGRASVWLKDDGAFGSGGWGGNKVRKLEWVLADARRRRARTLLTVGALGTNWGLATALYGREHGFAVVLALVDQPLDEHVRRQLERLRASGARLHFTRTKLRTLAAWPLLLARHMGRRPPYVLPPGGSSPIGALGYVEAGLELAGQVQAGELPEPSHVVVAMGSGGSASGLLLGLRLAGLGTRVVGVPVTDQLRLDERSARTLALRAERLLRRRGAALPELGRGDVGPTVLDGFIGPGYGHPTDAARAATALAREREGLELEPVYTAKALAALLAENAAGRFGDGPVLFLHTSGPR